MSNKYKCKRLNFAISEDLDELIRRLSEETEWTLVKIIEKSVTMYAEFHDKGKDGK